MNPIEHIFTVILWSRESILIDLSKLKIDWPSTTGHSFRISVHLKLSLKCLATSCSGNHLKETNLCHSIPLTERNYVEQIGQVC